MVVSRPTPDLSRNGGEIGLGVSVTFIFDLIFISPKEGALYCYTIYP